MNTVFEYVQRKMADERKKTDHKRSACKKELNEFSDMSLEQKAASDDDNEEYWKFGPSKQQKGVFKTKNMFMNH